MHELLKHVLTERDLTRAGDLFGVPDADIVNDLNEVVSTALTDPFLLSQYFQNLYFYEGYSILQIDILVMCLLNFDVMFSWYIIVVKMSDILVMCLFINLNYRIILVCQFLVINLSK